MILKVQKSYKSEGKSVSPHVRHVLYQLYSTVHTDISFILVATVISSSPQITFSVWRLRSPPESMRLIANSSRLSSSSFFTFSLSSIMSDTACKECSLWVLGQLDETQQAQMSLGKDGGKDLEKGRSAKEWVKRTYGGTAASAHRGPSSHRPREKRGDGELTEFKCVRSHLPCKVIIFGVYTRIVQGILFVRVVCVPRLGWLGKGWILLDAKETSCFQEDLRHQ